MRRRLSQYWKARESEIRPNAVVEGAAQSVSNTGSQTTKARTGLPANSSKVCSVAEAPCRHIGQVGDKRTTTRTSSWAAFHSRAPSWARQTALSMSFCFQKDRVFGHYCGKLEVSKVVKVCDHLHFLFLGQTE